MRSTAFEKTLPVRGWRIPSEPRNLAQLAAAEMQSWPEIRTEPAPDKIDDLAAALTEQRNRALKILRR